MTGGACGRRQRLLVQGVERRRSTRRRWRPTPCCRSTPSACPRLKSTTRSTACRAPRCSRTGRRSRRPTFRFAIKASRRITHIGRLKAESVADSVDYLYKNLAALGDKRGPVLFQLPPNLKKDVPRLTAFLALLPADHRAAFEFRNDTWFDDDVYEALKGAGASLCFSEREDDAPPPLVETAPWGYVRLRLENYSDADLAQWAGRHARDRLAGDLRLLHARAHRARVCGGADASLECMSEHVIRTPRTALEPQTAVHAAEMFVVLQDPRIYEHENEPPASEAVAARALREARDAPLARRLRALAQLGRCGSRPARRSATCRRPSRPTAALSSRTCWQADGGARGLRAKRCAR